MKLHIILIFIIFQFFGIILSQVTYTVEYYGHYYVSRTTTSLYRSQAMEFCKNTLTSPVPGYEGYLATFTSDKEWSDVLNLFQKQGYPNIDGWEPYQGAYTLDGYSYYYDNGPEINQLQYNLSSNTCNTFCSFAATYPAISPKSSVVMKKIGSNWSMVTIGFRTSNIICEFSPIGTPGLQTLTFLDFKYGIEDPLFNTLTISDIPSNKVIQSVNFTNIDDNNTFLCYDLVLEKSNVWKCTYRSFGRFDVLIETTNLDGTNNDTYPIIYHQSNPPKPSYLSYTMDIGYLIHVRGVGLKNAIINFGINSDIPCVYINSTQLDVFCKVSNPTLPISINSAKVSFKTYNIPLYYSNAGFLTSIITSKSIYTDIIEKASQFDVLGLKGYMQGIIEDKNENVIYEYAGQYASFLNNFLPNQLYWMNYLSFSGKQGVLSQSGPFEGQLVDAFSANITFDPYSASNSQYILFETGTSNVYRRSFTESYGFIVEYGGLDPFFEETILNYDLLGNPSPFILPTSGAIENPVGIKVNNARIRNSKFLLGDQTINITMVSPFKLDILFINIPAGFGGPFQLNYIGNGDRSSNSLLFSYNRPSLISVYPSFIPFNGGEITISGNDFSNTASAINVYLDVNVNADIQCQNIVLLEDHKAIKCNLPQGSDSTYKLYVSVGNQQSINSLDIQYNGFPIVNGYSNVIFGQDDSKITIYGERFSKNGNISVDVGGQNGVNVNVVSENMITFDFDAIAIPAEPYMPLVINLNFQSNTTYKLSSAIFFYDNNIDCLNECTGRGICDRNLGLCNCFPGYGSEDCSLSLVPPNIRPDYNIQSGETTLTNDDIEFYKFKPIGARFISSSSPDTYSNIEFEPFTTYFSNDAYSDINLHSSVDKSYSIKLFINFTQNPQTSSFALLNVNPYPYSTTYTIQFSLYNITATQVELLYLLQYSDTVETEEMDETGCTGTFKVESDNRQYYSLINSRTSYHSKFSQRVWKQQYTNIEKTNMIIYNNDLPNFNIKPLNGYKHKVLSQFVHSIDFESQVNFGIQKVYNNCSNIELIQENWEKPLIGVSVSLCGVIIIVAVVITVKSICKIKQKKEINIEQENNIELSTQ